MSAAYVVGCILSVVSGCMLATQSGINSTLGKHAGKSFASVVSFGVGLVALLLFFAVDAGILHNLGPTREGVASKSVHGGGRPKGVGEGPAIPMHVGGVLGPAPCRRGDFNSTRDPEPLLGDHPSTPTASQAHAPPHAQSDNPHTPHPQPSCAPLPYRKPPPPCISSPNTPE